MLLIYTIYDILHTIYYILYIIYPILYTIIIDVAFLIKNWSMEGSKIIIFEVPNRSIFDGFPYEKPPFLRLLYKSAFGTPKSAKTIEKLMVF